MRYSRQNKIIEIINNYEVDTQEKLASFFPNVLSFAALYDRLLNLEERLILFCHKDNRERSLC